MPSVLKEQPELKNQSDDELVKADVAEFDQWRLKCEPYWADMKINEQFYQGYNSEDPSQIPTNTAVAIVESLVARTMDVTRKVQTRVPGPVGTINRKIAKTVSNVVDSIIDDPEITFQHGSYTAAKEVMARDLFVIGNMVGEINYAYMSSEGAEGTTKVQCDGVYLEPLEYTQYVFNIASTWEKSPTKYIQKWTSYDALKDAEYKEWTDDDGTVHTTGKYKNLDKLTGHSDNGAAPLEMGVNAEPYASGYYTSSGGSVSQYVEDIELIFKWRGAMLRVIADRKWIIWEEYDPFGIGRDNLLLAMNYKYKKRPFGFGEIDWIRGIIQLKDQSFNQRAAVVERSLKPGVLITDPNANTDTITDVIINGGAATASAGTVTNINQVNLPQQAFMMANEYQQEIERTARWSAYAAGMSGETTDKTRGTASGIHDLQTAAEPNFKIKLRIFEERIDTPFTRIGLRMIANFTGDDDTRWSLRAGSSDQYAKITRGFLTGDVKLSDLESAGIIDASTLHNLTHTAHPATGEAMPIPGAKDAHYVQGDWVMKVTLDPQNASDKYQRAQMNMNLASMATQNGQQMDWKNFIADQASLMGSDDFDEYFLSGQALAQQNQQAQQQQAQQQAHEKEMAQMQFQQQLQLLQVKNQHDAALEAAKQQHPPKQLLNYKDAPPTIQRQMESADGYSPASPIEHAAQVHQLMPALAPTA